MIQNLIAQMRPILVWYGTVGLNAASHTLWRIKFLTFPWLSLTMPVIFPWPNKHATATFLYILVGSSSPTPTPCAIITTFWTTESEKAQNHEENNKLSAHTLTSSYFALKRRQISPFSFASYQNSLTFSDQINSLTFPDFTGEWEPCLNVQFDTL